MDEQKEKNIFIKRMVLDVLKPHEPPIHELASRLASLNGIDNVVLTLLEIDQSTESIKVSLEGDNINIEAVKKNVEEAGAVVHSIDEVIVSKKTLHKK
ncbi:MAG: DUF211 domain-containing protein [Candidatus Bathyarchaeia archaeon]